MSGLVVSGLRKSFGSLEIIKGVNLSIAKGERHAVIGPNGAGKSTLFHLITGRFPASAGKIMLDGADITGKSAHDIFRAGLARSFQVTSLFPKLSVFENLRCGAMRTHGAGMSVLRLLSGYRALAEQTEATMEALGLAHRRAFADQAITVETRHATTHRRLDPDRLTQALQQVQLTKDERAKLAE